MTAKRKRKHYRRSTPIGRLRRNAGKIAVHVGLAQNRLKSWQNGVPNFYLQKVWTILEEINNLSLQVEAMLQSLEDTNWQPPKKSSTLHFEVGQHVSIAPKSRERYAQIFGSALQRNPDMMDDLTIVAILPSGGISVRRGRGTPCLISAKSHLVPVT